MKRVMERVAVVAAMAAVVGCGGKQDTTSSVDPTTTEPAPAQWQDGIYVAAYDGSDSNPGTAYAPMRTINAAIDRARSEGKRDVWIYGGGFNAGYAEVVVLKAGINLHGSICKTDNPPAEADPACPSSIVGGSPSLVAIDIRENTVVENLEIVGLPGVQSGGPNDGFFAVDGIGCVGRGITNGRLPSCDRPVDKEGRMTPFSSVAGALSGSNAVFFRGVSIVSGDGANGIDGSEGAVGASSVMPANGQAAGDREYKAGAGAKTIVNAACPDPAGGRGGQGGRFRWNLDNVAWSESGCNPANGVPAICHPFFTTNLAHGGSNGADSFLATGSATIAPSYNGFQAGAIGRNGLSGAAGFEGDDGLAGIREIDLVSLTAGEGNRGDRGRSGTGGAGGSGGNPATVRVYKKESASSSGAVTILGVAGSNSSGNSEYALNTSIEAMAGGGGGAGGAGGCGGEGGTGGQGGASSVGIYLVDSVLGADATTVATGKGGQGGRGGFGGIGGQGASGSEGGAGRSREAHEVVGSLTSSTGGGMFSVFTGSSQQSYSWTNGLSASRGGKGGTGGQGGDGGAGGVGGAGAGGSSIGVVAKGASSITGAVEFELSIAGEPGAQGGEAGVATDILSL